MTMSPSTSDDSTTTSQQSTTEMEHAGNALIFLAALHDDQGMKKKWDKTLKQANNPSLTKVERTRLLNNFLNRHGYDTTVQYVFQLGKSKPWMQMKKASVANKQSDRFVQDTLRDPQLLQEFAAYVKQGAAANDATVIDTWIQNKGYDCTSEQVYASMRKMRNHNLNAWTGIYGRNTLSQSGVHRENVLPLVVHGDDIISIGPTDLFQISYKDGTLTWPRKCANGLTNPCKGELTFSQMWQEVKGDPYAYTGNTFSGTLEYPTTVSEDDDPAVDTKGNSLTGKWDYIGFIADIPKTDSKKPPIPSTVDKKNTETVWTILSKTLSIGFAIMLFAGAMGFIGKRIRGLTEFLAKRAQKTATDTANELEKISESDIGGNEILNKNLDKPSTVRDLEKELEKNISPEEMQQKINEASEEAERDAAEQVENSTKSTEETAKELEVEEPLPELESLPI